MIDQGLLEEADDRTVSPFAAVITEYRRHAAKVIQRPSKSGDLDPVTPNRVKAVFYYNQQAASLETL